MFVLGFSLVFIVGWGGAATALGQLFGAYKPVLAKIGGVIILLFGLANLRVIRIPWLYYDTRPQWKRTGSQNLFSSGLMGMFFAAGWTPCIGTTLGAILTLGFSQETSSQAMVLASGYALGLGLPFLAIGLGIDRATHALLRFRKYLRLIEIASGILLMAVGVLILTDRMTLIAAWALHNRFFLDLPIGATSAPNYLIAILAGLLSFLSPCVLPLIPAYIGYLGGNALQVTPAGAVRAVETSSFNQGGSK
jgi:cytochrome c-type biogenesis protein